ncbi:M15 family metallopeptidase [Solicola sp. PLA-1-18]|uniref:M15 family metallopeptidase n=1 Tax=Solicola sp. PLA-1-18 TaxID=3380532 RepID=UPI003B8080D7
MRPTLLLVTLTLLLTACSGGGGAEDAADEASSAPSSSASPSTVAPSTTPAPTTAAPTTPAVPTTADPVTTPLPRAQWREMRRLGMWREGCPATRAQLRRLELNYYDWDGQVQRGVLVVNRDVAPSLSRIFTRLFEERFPIRRMQSVEAYDGDSDASLKADNTAVYNCRRPDQINAPPTASPHANGRAIDINPRENPWMDPRCECWSPIAKYAERTEGKGKILKGGLVWRLFEKEGWIWQNIDVADYMHFDTGYPSKPWSSPRDD